MDEIIKCLKDKYKESIKCVGSLTGIEEVYIQANDSVLKICLFLINTYKVSLIDLFANDERNWAGCFSLYYVFALEGKKTLLILKYSFPEGKVIESISREVPAASHYEMEIRDLFGIEFLKPIDQRRMIFHSGTIQEGYPLRKDFSLESEIKYNDYKKDYLKIEGTGVFQIPVGPVHAGIIEPGHFRFSVAGEPIINLEAELYYCHKGIEKLAENKSINYALLLSERISGDETFSNSLAYCMAVEKIAGLEKLPVRVDFSRVIFGEMERIYNHLGDIGGVCTDIAYGFAASQFALMRRWCQIANEQLTGSRFLRNVNRPGGLRRDYIKGKESIIEELLNKIEKEFLSSIRIMRENSTYIDRVENTGIVKKEVAKDLHAVGPAARAAGISQDARKQFPYAGYAELEFDLPEHNLGDVNCRVNVKIEEVIQSISLIKQALRKMPAEGEIFVLLEKYEPYACAFGITESPRGENVHWVMSGPGNTIYRYKVRTPSFCNWPVLCSAMPGNIVPDFPLINKSFNLSYSGNDL